MRTNPPRWFRHVVVGMIVTWLVPRHGAAGPLPAPDVAQWLARSQVLDCEQPEAERNQRKAYVLAARMAASGAPNPYTGAAVTVPWPALPVILANAQLQIRWGEHALAQGVFCRDLASNLRDAMISLSELLQHQDMVRAHLKLSQLEPRVRALLTAARGLDGNPVRVRLADTLETAKSTLARLEQADRRQACAPDQLKADGLVEVLEQLARDLDGSERLKKLLARNSARCRAARLLQSGDALPDATLLALARSSFERYKQGPVDKRDAMPPSEMVALMDVIDALELSSTLEGARLKGEIAQQIQARRLQAARQQVLAAGGPDITDLRAALGPAAAALQQRGGSAALQGQALADLPSGAALGSEKARERLSAQAKCYEREGDRAQALAIYERILAALARSERPGSKLWLEAELDVAERAAELRPDRGAWVSRVRGAIARYEAEHPAPRTGLVARSLDNAYAVLARVCTRDNDTACVKSARAVREGYAKSYANATRALTKAAAAPATGLTERLDLIQHGDPAQVLERLRAAPSIDAISLTHLAHLELEAGNHAAAASALEDSAAGFEVLADGMLALGVARATGADAGASVQHAAALLQNLHGIGSLAAALAAQGVLPERMTALAFWLAEQRKGRLFDARGLRRPAQPDRRPQFELARSARAQRARRFLEAYPARVSRCAELDEGQAMAELEAQFAERGHSPLAALQGVSFTLGAPRSAYPRGGAEQFVRTVSQRLRPGARLISLVRTHPLQERAVRSVGAGWSEAQYVGFVLGPEGLRTAALGPAAALDSDVAALLASIDQGRGAKAALAPVEAASEALSKLLMTPLRDALKQTTELWVSPDGYAAATPFLALRSGGRWLSELVPIVRVHSARTLLRNGDRPSQEPPLALIDPVPPGQAPGRFAGLGPRNFPALAGARAEGEALRAVYSTAHILKGAEANERALISAAAPSILHIASHAAFLDDSESGSGNADGARGMSRVTDAAAPAVAALEDQAQRLDGERAFLRSLLVLAPSESVDPGVHDGFVTAYEILSLDLHGTELVVLSACETGRGASLQLHGRASLERAFVTAGARALVSSGWPVDDEASAQWMAAFYTALAKQRDLARAVQTASATLRARHPHPYYWAPFSLLQAAYSAPR